MIAPTQRLGSSDAPDCQAVAGPLGQIVRELRGVIADLRQEHYARRMGPAFGNSTIGAHVRHAIDHVRALVEGQSSGTIDYDHRQRGTPIETDPAAADAELARLIVGVDRLGLLPGDQRVTVVCVPTREGASASLSSTLGRELAFVLGHTIHHNATLRGMIVSLERPVPASFGYAPSTLAFQDARECAR
jgi:hypothetical protein